MLLAALHEVFVEIARSSELFRSRVEYTHYFVYDADMFAT